MDFRDSKFRSILIVVALGIALVVVVASCGGDGGNGADDGSSSSQGDDGKNDKGEDGDSEEPGEDADPQEQAPLAQVTGEEEITLTVTRAEREEGGFLTVEGTIHNGGGENWRANAWRGPEIELADNGFSMAGATITAKAEGKKYLILRDTAGRCLCTIFDLHIGADKTVNWFAQFPAPEATTTEVDFQIGQLPPATFEIR
jgi:hypothetical protein